MINKFVHVPVDTDTRIRFQQVIQFGEYEVLYQKWSWEGISAESIVFANEDIAGLADEAIEQTVRSLRFCKPGSSITLKRSDTGFTFVNFNFEQS